MSDGTPMYDPAELQAFFEQVSERLTALERWAVAISANGALQPQGLETGAPAPDGTGQVDEARREAAAIVAEAEATATARLAEADRQAQMVVEQARMEGRSLVEAVRDSLNDALRLRDEEVLAAVGESHSRVLAMLGDQLRKAEPAG